MSIKRNNTLVFEREVPTLKMTQPFVNKFANSCILGMKDAARTKQMCWYLYSYFLMFNNIQNNFIDHYVSDEGETEKSKLFFKITYGVWNEQKKELSKRSGQDQRNKVCEEAKSIIVLQSAGRKYLAREKYVRMKEESKARHLSIVKLQNWMRTLLAKKEFEVQKLERKPTERSYYHAGQYLLKYNWNLSVSIGQRVLVNLQDSIGEKGMLLNIVEGIGNMSNLTHGVGEFDHAQEEIVSTYEDNEGAKSCIRWRTLLVGSIDNLKCKRKKSLMTGSIEILK